MQTQWNDWVGLLASLFKQLWNLPTGACQHPKLHLNLKTWDCLIMLEIDYILLLPFAYSVQIISLLILLQTTENYFTWASIASSTSRLSLGALSFLLLPTEYFLKFPYDFCLNIVQLFRPLVCISNNKIFRLFTTFW